MKTRLFIILVLGFVYSSYAQQHDYDNDHNNVQQTKVTDLSATQTLKTNSDRVVSSDTWQKINPANTVSSGYQDVLNIPDKNMRANGCCTKTATFSHKPIDRNSSFTWSNAITFSTGSNTGTGSCEIPAGAIIKTCVITVRNPSIADPVDPLTHGQVSVYIAGSSVGATNRFDVIGGGIPINANNVSGMPVNGFGIDVVLAGTNLCGNNHSHLMSITVDVTVCWVEANVYYQSSSGQQNTFLGNCMVNLGCGDTLPNVFADNGTLSSGGFYSNDINFIYRTFCPDTIGKCIRATVEYMDIEPPVGGVDYYDVLYVSNGPAQNSTDFWIGNGTLTSVNTLSGTWDNPFVANNSSGCLTLRFRSDPIVNAGGFYITLDCVDCTAAEEQTNADCVNSIPTCGNMSFSGASYGPGYESTCSGCITSENFSTWYYFEFTESGTLGLTLEPNDTDDDYDFALFKASNCSSLGAPVRCSYAEETGSTGMGNGAIDTSEDVYGNGWVSTLSVNAGDAFFLLVNNWTATAGGYDLNFTLTNGAVFEDCDSLPPLPVEYVSFEGNCSEGNTTLLWSTASETNNDYFTIMKSYNGFMFKTVGWVMGIGNSNQLQSYKYTDQESESGKVYYQLKQTDFDGEITYSKMIAVECGQTHEFNMIVADNTMEAKYLEVMFDAVPDIQYNISMTDAQGKTVFYTLLDSNSDYIKHKISTDGFTSGIYILNVQSQANTHSQKIMIQ